MEELSAYDGWKVTLEPDLPAGELNTVAAYPPGSFHLGLVSKEKLFALLGIDPSSAPSLVAAQDKQFAKLQDEGTILSIPPDEDELKPHAVVPYAAKAAFKSVLAKYKVGIPPTPEDLGLLNGLLANPYVPPNTVPSDEDELKPVPPEVTAYKQLLAKHKVALEPQSGVSTSGWDVAADLPVTVDGWTKPAPKVYSEVAKLRYKARMALAGFSGLSEDEKLFRLIQTQTLISKAILAQTAQMSGSPL